MRICILLVLFIISNHSIALASHDRLNELAKKGMDLAYDMKFDEAIATFDELIQKDPNDAQGYFLKAACYLWMYGINMNDETLGEKVKAFSLLTADVAKQILKKDENNIDALYYMGVSYGNIARYFGMTKNYLNGYWYAKKAKNCLLEVLEKDPENYDVYIGLGLYHYYADVMPKFIKVLSFLLGIEGDREKGIKELRLAIAKSDFTRTEAMYYLADLLLYYEKNYEDASVLFEELVKKYPNNILLGLNLGQSYHGLQKHDQAVEIYEAALNSDTIAKNLYFKKYFHYNLGLVYFELNDFKMAVTHHLNCISASELYENKAHFYPYSWALYEAAECYAILDDREKSRNYYQSIKKEEDKNAFKAAQIRLKDPLTKTQIELIKGKNYCRTKQYDKARLLFCDLIKKEETANAGINKTMLAELYYNLGKIEFETREYQKAIETLSKVLSFDNVREEWIKPWSHFQLGNCYKGLGDTRNAIMEYDIACSYKDKELCFEIDKARETI